MTSKIRTHKYNTRNNNRIITAVCRIQKNFRTKILQNRIFRLIKYKTCSICLDKIRLNNVRFLNCCDHVFHKKCIKKWIKEDNICPNCRTIIPLRCPKLSRFRYFLWYFFRLSTNIPHNNHNNI